MFLSHTLLSLTTNDFLLVLSLRPMIFVLFYLLILIPTSSGIHFLLLDNFIPISNHIRCLLLIFIPRFSISRCLLLILILTSNHINCLLRIPIPRSNVIRCLWFFYSYPYLQSLSVSFTVSYSRVNVMCCLLLILIPTSNQIHCLWLTLILRSNDSHCLLLTELIWIGHVCVDLRTLL